MAALEPLALCTPCISSRFETALDSSAGHHRAIADASAISSERLQRLYRYWESLKDGQFAPKRTELNPSHMKDQLGWIWLMDVIDGGTDFRFRMGGDRVIQFFGAHMAGMTLRDILPKAPHFFGRFMELLMLATEARQPTLSGPSQAAYEPKSYLEIEVLVLPLSDDGVNVTGMIGGMEVRPLVKTVDPRD